jgi:hypothetical protein
MPSQKIAYLFLPAFSFSAEEERGKLFLIAKGKKKNTLFRSFIDSWIKILSMS